MFPILGFIVSASLSTLVSSLTTIPEDDLVFPQDASRHPLLDSFSSTSYVLPQIQSTTVENPLVMAYYPDWAANSLAPEDIDFTRFDWIDFAFGLPDQYFALTWDDPEVAPGLLSRLVQAAHTAGKNVKLSIGGWTGSTYFSPAVSNDKNRNTFVSNIVNLYNLYSLDGIDIDWEYPGQQGDPNNIVSSSDTANFLSFLHLLREKLPASAKISAATQTVPFAGADGMPLANATEFAKVLDWVLLMNYDTWGSSSAPGPNAPLDNSCNNSTQPSANAHAGINAWIAAGFPPSQIVLGIPAYGYISRSTASSLRNRRRSGTTFVTNESGGVGDGQVQFRELVNQGILQRTSSSSLPAMLDVQFKLSFSPSGINISSLPIAVNPESEQKSSFQGLHGFIRYWDECSSTPFLKSEDSEQIVSYDDPESLQLKGEWVKQAGILGVNMFDVHGDTEEWDLVNGVRKGLGLSG